MSDRDLTPRERLRLLNELDAIGEQLRETKEMVALLLRWTAPEAQEQPVEGPARDS